MDCSNNSVILLNLLNNYNITTFIIHITYIHIYQILCCILLFLYIGLIFRYVYLQLYIKLLIAVKICMKL